MTQGGGKVTICIITAANDAQTERAIASSAHCPILLIDTGSSNEWNTLTGKYASLQVVKYPVSPITDFAAVRNFALNQCHTEWTFFLDSDESILPNQEKKLLELVASTDCAGYSVLRKDTFLGITLHHGEASQRIIRLVRTADTRFEGKVHEVAVVQGSVRPCTIVLRHFSHASISQFGQDVAVYAQIAGTAKQQGFWGTVVELVCYPPAKFMLNFFCKLGILDGWRGLVYACMMSYHSIFVRVFRYEKSIKN